MRRLFLIFAIPLLLALASPLAVAQGDGGTREPAQGGRTERLLGDLVSLLQELTRVLVSDSAARVKDREAAGKKLAELEKSFRTSLEQLRKSIDARRTDAGRKADAAAAKDRARIEALAKSRAADARKALEAAMTTLKAELQKLSDSGKRLEASLNLQAETTKSKSEAAVEERKALSLRLGALRVQIEKLEKSQRSLLEAELAKYEFNAELRNTELHKKLDRALLALDQERRALVKERQDLRSAEAERKRELARKKKAEEEKNAAERKKAEARLATGAEGSGGFWSSPWTLVIGLLAIAAALTWFIRSELRQRAALRVLEAEGAVASTPLGSRSELGGTALPTAEAALAAPPVEEETAEPAISKDTKDAVAPPTSVEERPREVQETALRELLEDPKDDETASSKGREPEPVAVEAAQGRNGSPAPPRLLSLRIPRGQVVEAGEDAILNLLASDRRVLVEPAPRAERRAQGSLSVRFYVKGDLGRKAAEDLKRACWDLGAEPEQDA